MSQGKEGLEPGLQTSPQLCCLLLAPPGKLRGPHNLAPDQQPSAGAPP